MTKRLWALHSWLGLMAGLGLLVIGVTGSALVFRDQLDAIFAAKVTRVEPTPEGRLSWDRLHAAAQAAWPEYDVTGFGPRRDPRLADLVYLVRHGSQEDRVGTLNPYTGVALASPLRESETFTGLLLELHYTWFGGHVGILITGVFGVLLCLLGVTGVWLYRGFWKSFFTLRWGRSARIFFSDLHKMVGISSVAFNLILGFTGAYWNITHVMADGLGGHDESETKAAGSYFAEGLSLDAFGIAAAERIPGFETRWVSFPMKPGEDITLWGKVPATHPFAGEYGSSVIFDAQTGAIKSFVDLREAGWWTKFTDTFTALHFGTFGGLAVQVLWCLLGLAPGILSVSGFLIWRSRRRSSISRERAAQSALS